MSTMSGGPNIVTNGLVLHLDAANTKSFRGEPTTNLANTDSSRTIQQHSPTIYGNVATMSDAPEKGFGWKKIIITNRGNNFRIAQFPYITQPSGTTRTYSLEIDYASTTGYFIRGDGFSGFGANSTTNGIISRTFTTTTNSGALALFLNHDTTGVSGINDTIYYRYYQVEDKAYATTFTETSRGTTVATGGGWADRTPNANHGELVNGPTYNAANGGSIVFDGTNDHALMSSIATYGNNTTWEAWVFCTANVSGYNMFFGRYLPYFSFYNGDRLFFSNLIGGTQQTISTTSNLSYNTWYYATFTTSYDGVNTTMKIYTNGIETATGTWAGSQGNYNFKFMIGDGNGASDGVGGLWYPFQGRISSVKVYNRTLSASEILQNYNSQKSRFGLP